MNYFYKNCYIKLSLQHWILVTILHLLFIEKNCYISLRTASGTDVLSITWFQLKISLFLLITNLCFQVVIVLVKNCFLLHISYTLESFHKPSITRFLTASKFLKVIDSFVAETWSFRVFHGEFLKFMKWQTSLSKDCSFICPSILLLSFFFIGLMLLKILTLQLSLKHAFTEFFWTLLLNYSQNISVC